MKQITGCIIICLFLLSPVKASSTNYKPDHKQSWQHYFKQHEQYALNKQYPYQNCFEHSAKQYELPVPLLVAVAKGESNFDPNALSSANAMGIMQIVWPQTANHLGITSKEQLKNPCININAGAKYIRQLLNRYDNDLYLTLAAYNYGPGTIRKEMDTTTIPKGANWYSGYIYQHLSKVVQPQPDQAQSGQLTIPTIQASNTNQQKPNQKIYQSNNHLMIIRFEQAYRAENLVNYLTKKLPGMEINYFKTSQLQYQVVLYYENQSQRQQGSRGLKKLGFTTKERSNKINAFIL